jgi:hypothetical protein
MIITLIGCAITIFINYLIKEYKKKILFLSKTISLILFILAISIFIYAINELSTITVGGIMGQGYIDSNIIKGGSNIQLNSNWGFGLGFYFYLISLVILILNMFYFNNLSNGEDLKWKRKRK